MEKVGSGKVFRAFMIILLIGVLCYGLYQLWTFGNEDKREARVREQMSEFKPVRAQAADLSANANNDESGENKHEASVPVNPSLAAARLLNADIVGWVTVDGTRIDYPFVQADDNDYYLRRNIHGSSSQAGTPFLDYRCAPDLSDHSAIIYGHNMKSGTMFADITRYANADFFNSNQTGTLFLPDATYHIEIFAYMVVSSDDSLVYHTGYSDPFYRQRRLEYLQENAGRWRGGVADASDILLVLSTCAYDYREARHVIIARLEKIY